MNDELNTQLLAELRKLRKLTRSTSIAALALLFGFILYTIYRSRPQADTSHEQPRDSWSQVSSAIDHADYDKAREIAQRLVQKHPQDYYGYVYLGNVALAKGDLQTAESHYRRAYELFPSEENQKTLAAIEKRRHAGAQATQMTK